jgi:hypothetical protein
LNDGHDGAAATDAPAKTKRMQLIKSNEATAQTRQIHIFKINK